MFGYIVIGCGVTIIFAHEMGVTEKFASELGGDSDCGHRRAGGGLD